MAQQPFNSIKSLDSRGSSWIPWLEGKEISIYGTIQLQSHFVSFQSLPKLAIWQPFCIAGLVTSVCLYSSLATPMNSYSCTVRQYFGSMLLLKKMLHSTKKKKVSESSGWRYMTMDHCMVELRISTCSQCASQWLSPDKHQTPSSYGLALLVGICHSRNTDE